MSVSSTSSSSSSSSAPSSVLGKRPFTSYPYNPISTIFKKSYNSEEYVFQKDKLTFQIILAFNISHENPRCDLHQDCKTLKKQRKYIVLEKPTNIIRIYDLTCLIKKGISPERNDEFIRLVQREDRFAAILRLWYYAGIISRDQIPEKDEERKVLCNKLRNTTISESLESLTKNINDVAYPRLLIKAYKEGIVTSDETLTYLQNAYKASISAEKLAAIEEINKRLLMNHVQLLSTIIPARVVVRTVVAPTSVPTPILIPTPHRVVPSAEPIFRPISRQSAANFYALSTSYQKEKSEQINSPVEKL